MILEPPLKAYFHTDFCHLSPLGKYQLSMDGRAETRLAFASTEGPLTEHKISLGEIRLHKLSKPTDKCSSNILRKEATYLSKWIFVPLAALNSYFLWFRFKLKMSECSSRFPVY